MSLVAHPADDVRSAAVTVVQRLTVADPEVASVLARELMSILLDESAPEPVVASLARLVKGTLSNHLGKIEAAMVWKLLQAKNQDVQEIGGVMLNTHIDPATLSMDDLVALGNREALNVRESAWAICKRDVAKVRREVEVAVGMLDSRWDDTRAFAFSLFRTEVRGEDLTPEAMIGICDSVREDVQRFGQELIQTHFREESGTLYLLRLSEHPAQSVQLFVTNYLERFGQDPERLSLLEPYLLRVLTAVNRGRATKRRAWSFLERQALADEVSAQIAARILDRLSASISVETKEAALLLMVKIRRKYPQVGLPIEVRAPEVRVSGHREAQEIQGGV